MVVIQRTDNCITPFQMNFILNARIFWRELAIWTRMFFRGIYLGAGDVDEIFERMFDVPNKFASALRLFFGNQFSDGYTQLLDQHLIILRELTSAHKAGDMDAVTRNVERLYQNSHERGEFLAQFNPFWNEDEWRSLMDTYLQYTLEEANAIAADEQSKSIEIYEKIIAHSNLMGDYFSQGLFNYIVYVSQNNLQSQRLKGNRFARDRCITYDQMEAIYNIRMFWFELTAWTRALFVVMFGNVGYLENILERISVIIEEYQAVLRPILGEEATEEYIKLINEYVALLVAFAKAQKEGNVEEINQYTQLLYSNFEQRASFLATINPDFNKDAWTNMLYNYARYTFNESTSYLTGDQTKSLNNFRRLLDLSLELGVEFADGFYSDIVNGNKENLS